MTRKTDRSAELFQQAQACFPGGVNSPVRAFRGVGGQPLFIERGAGPYLYDVDGNRYIDFMLSWGPLILGHAHPQVVAALQAAVERGTSYGAPNPAEVELAELIRAFMPGMESLRFVSSGTEATMSALRLARAYTARDKIIKFEGCYHGHADYLLVKAGSGVATLGLPDSPGVPAGAVQDTLIARYNDLAAVSELFERFPGQVAALIVEPVAGNMGVVLPQAGFLAGLRRLTAQHGALLIFDEVMTGFRAHPGGAQALYGVQPDLTTLGKVIGGGLPVGAYGGRREILSLIAPSGPVYQAGTLSGNPLAMAAGIATLQVLQQPGTWEKLEASADRLASGLARAAQAAGVPVQVQRAGTMFTTFFAEGALRDWTAVKGCDTACYAGFFHAMLDEGVYLPPSQFEASFLSTAHDEAIIQRTLEAAGSAFQRVGTEVSPAANRP
jgi:glutamate-1-semialdehyde 2,1-aminomutase